MAIKNYDYDVQKMYLELMLSDAETFVRCQSIFDHSLFDKKLQPAAEFILEYVKGYTVLPDYNMVNTSCRANLKPPSELKEGHTAWLIDEFEQFIRHKSLERAIIASADLLDQHDYGSVEALIKEAVQIGLARDMGIDYYEDPRTRLMGLKDKNGQVSTGWDSLDRMLYGGFNRGELEVFCAQSGGGKSIFLANLSLNFSMAGLNVIYITMELSEPLVGMRIDSMLTGIGTRDVFKQLDDVEMKVKMIGKKSGSLQIKYIPSGKTVNDIRSYLKEYEVKTGLRADVVVIDYMDLLMPIGKKISAENLFIKDKYVAEEIRNLAVEKQVVALVASQLNRTSVEEVEFDHSHISGGISKIQTADNVFGIFTSRAMRERGRYQLQFMKTRNSSGVGQKIDLDFNIESLRVSDVPEAEQEASGIRISSSTESLLDNIKRKTSLENANAIPVTVISSKGTEVGSTKLRSIINNLGTEEDEY
jgi:KaiC/GvpD/RAD55 family RecA-like ATPase